MFGFKEIRKGDISKSFSNIREIIQNFYHYNEERKLFPEVGTEKSTRKK